MKRVTDKVRWSQINPDDCYNCLMKLNGGVSHGDPEAQRVAFFICIWSGFSILSISSNFYSFGIYLALWLMTCLSFLRMQESLPDRN